MMFKLSIKNKYSLIIITLLSSILISCNKKKNKIISKKEKTIVGYVYTSTNGENDNQIIQLARFSDGTLGKEKVYPTGGKGGSNSSAPVNGDYDSQGAIQIIDNYLLTINTGDNTVSVFNLDRKTGNLKKNDIVTSHGQKPVSITYTKSKTESDTYWVVVANQWGIPTALYDRDKYIELPNKDFFKQNLKSKDFSDKDRNISLYKFNTKTGKLTFNKLLDSYKRYWGGPVQVIFSHSGNQLALTTWGIPHFLTEDPNPKFVKPSQVIVYDFNNGQTSNKRIFEEEGLIGAVGFNWSKKDNLLYVTYFNPIKTKDNQGLVVLEITPSKINKVNGYETGASSDIDEACWSAVSPDYKYFYAVSFGTNVITPYKLDENGNIIKILPYTTVKNKDHYPDLKDMYISHNNKYAYCLGSFQTFTIKYFSIHNKGLQHTGEYKVKYTKSYQGKTGKFNFQGFVGYDI
ncbi:beta-propeller fold lactonase family protein [Flavobacterium oreochromis]|uniref:beta-propeller fold lactonase family protein n=1 Tax=Flavobacterium oreochromis TaxID=2906078 RepID=UPI00385C0FEE